MRTSRAYVVLGAVTGLCLSIALRAADVSAPAERLSAEQIVQKHVAARGGLAAWHALHTMTWSGKMDAGTADSVARSEAYVAQSWGKNSAKMRAAAQKGEQKDAPKQVQLPFVLDMKRPGKSRVELEFRGQDGDPGIRRQGGLDEARRT